jgi:uncharacterized protein (DUF1330 family)
MTIQPDEAQFQTLARRAGDDTSPKVMLNLNRYRQTARYEAAPPGGLDPEVSGHEAYLRYGAVAATVLERVGGRILWYAPAEWVVIGEDRDRFDEVIAVWYPSLSAFGALVSDPDLLAAHAHRAAGLERAAILCCVATPDATLRGPGDIASD